MAGVVKHNILTVDTWTLELDFSSHFVALLYSRKLNKLFVEGNWAILVFE